EEALANKREYIDLIDISVRAIIKEEVKTQLPQILPQAVLEFATPHKSSGKSAHVEEKSHTVDDSGVRQNQEFNTGRHVIPFDYFINNALEYLKGGSLSRKYSTFVTKTKAATYEDQWIEDMVPNIWSPVTHKSSGKSAHVEEKSHTVDDSGVRQNQEFNTGNNDEQPDDEAVSKSDWYKKLEQPLNPDPDWNKREYVDFRPSQTWISNIARAEKLQLHSISSWILQSTSLRLS
nr:hypothetical protein [Tanacetum cinerariifolium]